MSAIKFHFTSVSIISQWQKIFRKLLLLELEPRVEETGFIISLCRAHRHGGTIRSSWETKYTRTLDCGWLYNSLIRQVLDDFDWIESIDDEESLSLAYRSGLETKMSSWRSGNLVLLSTNCILIQCRKLIPS